MISLCMIVKNEEHNLGRCLKSAAGCVDEMIIADTGSEDGTIRVAERFGARVFHCRWEDDFAAARNFSISRASGDWIFYLDADEELEPGCWQRFRALAAHPSAEGYFFLINNLTDSRESVKHINLRLFRNRPGYRFRGRLHEQILDSIKETDGRDALILNSGINIFHYGYLASEFAAKNKVERNYRLNRLMVEAEPENPFFLYTLGNSCVNLNDLEGAESNYRRALRLANFNDNYVPSLLVSHIYILLRLGRLAEALKQIEDCRAHYPDYVDIHFMEGELYAGLGHRRRAEKCFNRCLSLGEQSSGRYTSRTGVGSFLALFELAKIHEARGELEKAVTCQIRGLKIKNSSLADFIKLARLLKASLKDGQKLLAALSRVIKNNSILEERLLLARLLYESGEPDISMALLNELPADHPEVCLLKGQALMIKGLFPEAICVLQRIPTDSPIYQAARSKLVLAHWLSAPSRDASDHIQTVLHLDREHYDTLFIINNLLLTDGIARKPDLGSPGFERVIEELLSLDQAKTVLKILGRCGMDSPESMVSYLAGPPTNEQKLELAAKIALHELKLGLPSADYYAVLSLYLIDHDELDDAQKLLCQAVKADPGAPLYRKLLGEITAKQSLKIVLAALEHYPDNPVFNQYLIGLQQDITKQVTLKGAH